jgi:flavin-dependent dehydrogenase
MECETLWDVIVVGAGPAGAVAARQLALQGKQVLLIEKARLPRDKVCGGCLGGAALEALNSIGLGELPMLCGGMPLTTCAFASEGALRRVPVGRRIAISRRTFDQALVREAARVGVVVRDGTRADFTAPSADLARVDLRRGTNRTTVQAKVLIIATGLGQVPPGFTQHCAVNSRVGLSALVDRAPCEGTSNTLCMAVAEAGYAGVTQVEGGYFDIAAAVDPQALAAAGAGRLVHHILKTSGLEPAMDLRGVRWLGTPPLTRCTAPLAGHRSVLVGDAASYVEPFTGEGIGWAIQSAVLASSLLAGPLDQWDSHLPRRWQGMHDEALASRKRRCFALSRALRLRSVRRLAVRGLHWAPQLVRPIVASLDRPFAAPRCR